MKHCINLPSHVGKQSHVFSCSCQRKPNSEYRNPYFSSHSLKCRPNLCKNLPTNAMFSFKLGSEDNGAVKSLPVLWCSKTFPYIALSLPGVGSSAFFSQYFYTADTFSQDRYRNSVCTFQGPEDTHRTWLTWTAPQDPFPCMLCPGSGSPRQFWLGNPWWPGQCHRSTCVQSCFCCSRLPASFPG